MRLIDRIGRWMRAEGHGVVEAIEDRRLLLKQALRDAELAVEEKQHTCRELEEQLADVDAVLARTRSEADAADRDIELALAEGREDLARFATRRLLPMRRSIEDNARRREEFYERLTALRSVIAEQSVELDELKSRIHDAIQRTSTGSESVSVARVVSDEEVELELLRRRAQGAS
ncbi:MAG: PspA/IM30 family protein [Myxococcota bacterium]